MAAPSGAASSLVGNEMGDAPSEPPARRGCDPSSLTYAVDVPTCPSCGEPTTGAARFCSACGAELDSSGGTEVRKTVTVLFADLTGSTALGEQLDPETLRRVLARYFEVARGCIERHGGTVEKFIGDAVMAVFGVPTVHEDDALRALRAASDLRAALHILNGELERDYGISLTVRTGVNTGQVVTGTDERLATGDAVNVAARLEQAAAPGEILIGEQTLLLARDAVDVEPVEPLTLKGKTEPVPAYRLLTVIEGAAAFDRRLDTPLIGRREQLALVHRTFERCASERACDLLTVLGPPGMGKSRLAREITSTLSTRATVLTGRCLPYGEGITFWPLVEIFREADADKALAAALASSGPEEIFWSVRKELEQRARDRALVLVFEDIHWAEPTLLDLIEHLVEWARDAPLLLVCLARPELLDDRPAWGGERLTLEPLSDEESAQLIAALFDDEQLDDERRTSITRTAEGNPLFVEQLLAMVADGGDLGEVPPTIQALLDARLDALVLNEREVLERAAVVGLEFEWEALGELAPDRRRPAGAQLASLVRKQLIQPHEAIEDSFRFRHILIRDAAYERLPKELRSELHERFAGWLDGRGAEFDEVVGHHLERAYRSLEGLGRPGTNARVLADRAAERLAAAGVRAHARGDTSATVNLVGRAIDLYAVDDPRRVRLLPTLGRTLRDHADLDGAEARFVEAVDLGGYVGDRGVVADASVALVDLRFHRTAETGVQRQDVIRTIDEAIVVFEEIDDEGGLAGALTLAGKLRFWAGEVIAAQRDLERAAHHARNAGDRAQEAEALDYVLTAMRYGPTPVEEGLERLEEIQPRAELNRRLEFRLLQARARFEAMLERFDVARELFARTRHLAEEHGFPNAVARDLNPSAGTVELLAGDPVASERLLRPACEAMEQSGELGFLSSVAPILIDALLGQGRDAEALELSERWRPELLTVPEDIDAQVSWRRVRARALARHGDLDEGLRLGREAVTMVAATDYAVGHAEALGDLGEVLHLAGQEQEATEALASALELHEAKGNLAAARRIRAALGERSVESPPIG